MRTKSLWVVLPAVFFFVFAPSVLKAQFESPLKSSPYGNNSSPYNSSDQELTSTSSSNTWWWKRCWCGKYHNPSCPPKQNIPFDGGLGLLLGAGVAYGFKKAYDKRKREKTDVSAGV